MNKALIQGGIIVAVFFATWFILAQIDWIEILHFEDLTNKNEEKLVKLFENHDFKAFCRKFLNT